MLQRQQETWNMARKPSSSPQLQIGELIAN
jgi:hypothetical protein